VKILAKGKYYLYLGGFMVTNIRLTASEIANLWTQYMNDSSAICMHKHVLKVVEDTDTREIYELALELSRTHVEIIRNILNRENHAVPVGFTDEDVNLEAPRLYADTFHLHYLHGMTTNGMTAYGLAIATSTRKDIREHFIKSNMSSMELYDKITDVLLSKGVYSRPPYIPYEQVDFVKSQNFLAGWFGERIPLNAVEINNIFFNIKSINMAKALFTGFSQVTKTEEVTQFLTDALAVLRKHIEIFFSVLNEDNLTTPAHWDSDVTTSTVSPFSDKFILYHTGVLLQAALGYYGSGMATSMRPDLVTQYARTIPEDLKQGSDWAHIMIKHGWLEQVPQAPDRKEIVSEKK
jgi:hypothetical protein